jgi:hypothetical protein
MSTASLTKYQIYCDTESQYVTGWSENPLDYCPNNNAHTVDEEKISSLETVYNKNSASTQIVYQYQIYCNTEAGHVSGWTKTVPTTCFNNNAHSVNLNSVQIVDVIQNSEVTLKQDTIYIARTPFIEPIDILQTAPESTQTVNYVFSSLSSMYGFSIYSDTSNIGDRITVAPNENTQIGLIASPITANDTTIYPPAAFFLYGSVGFTLVVSDGTNTDDLGMVKTINKDNGSVVVQNAAVHNFATNNTGTLMSYYTTKNFRIGCAGKLDFFSDIFGGTPVPAGTSVNFIYENTSTTVTKDITLSLTLLK